MRRQNPFIDVHHVVCLGRHSDSCIIAASQAPVHATDAAVVTAAQCQLDAAVVALFRRQVLVKYKQIMMYESFSKCR